MPNLIDVNNNTALTGSLAAEINQYRRELRQKDELIRDLSGTNNTVRFRESRDPRDAAYIARDFPIDVAARHNHTHYSEAIPYAGGHTTNGNGIHHHVHTGNTPTAVNTLTTIHDGNGSRSPLKDVELDRTRRELYDTRRILEREYEDRKLLESRRNTSDHHDLEVNNAKSKLLIERLQTENNQKSDRIIDLESRIKTILEDRELHVSSDMSVRNILTDSLIRLSGALSQATPTFSDDAEEFRTKCKESIDILVTAGNELSRELILAKASLAQAESELAKRDEARDGHNGTITQLCEELAESKKNLADKESELKQTTADKDSAEIQMEVKDKEIEVLRERLDNQIAVYDTLKGDQETSKTTNAETEAQFRQMQYEKRVAETELRTTLESLAHSLADPEDASWTYDDSVGISVIKDRIMKTIAAHREKTTAVTLLEGKVSQLTDQLEKQCELHAETLKRAKEHEHSFDNDRFRLKHLETELASQDVLRETYQTSKEKYIHFMNQLSNTLGITELSNNLGLDLSTMDMLLERVRQLANGETTDLAQKSSNNYILQRKIKELKNQVTNKDMHIDLLRKKLVKLDEQNITRESVYIDRDDAVKTAKKMEKRIYRLENDLGNEKSDNTRLRADLSELRTLQLRVVELERELDDKTNHLNRLEGKSFRQTSRLRTLKHDLTMTEADSHDVSQKLKKDLKSTKYDLKQTKLSLDEMVRQKKSLANFRQVIAKMLSLNVNSLSVPDFEIISRLEKLIQTHHVHQAASQPVRPILQGSSVHAAVPATVNVPIGHFTGNVNGHGRGSSEYIPVRRSRGRNRSPHQEDSSTVPIYDTDDILPKSRSKRYRSASPSRRHRTRY